MYKCTGVTDWGSPCENEYRQVGPHQWEYRYQGEETFPPAAREWAPIRQRTLEEIESLGHRLEEDV